MRNHLLLILSVVLLSSSANAQFLQTLIEVQGEQEVSPYENMEVTFNAKVTEAFGDFWYMQDAYGEWNGILVIEPDLLVPSNPPYWATERQPESGDELTLTGTVMEVDGNTQLMNVTLVEQTEFWLATPIGIEVDHISSQNEALEGTRVRMFAATVSSEADGNDEWTVSDGTGDVICLGIDDEAIPAVGDVYDVYGTLREFNGVYKIQISDIDVVSLSVDESAVVASSISPNPMQETSMVKSPVLIQSYALYSMQGTLVQAAPVNSKTFNLSKENLASGRYLLKLQHAKGTESHLITIQ